MSDNNININTPDIGPYTQLQPFRFWCQKVLPLVYDESLSYYELLCKVVDYLNKTMEDVDQMITDMGDFQTAFTDFENNIRDAYIEMGRKFDQLKIFVETYFDNLDVQTEINNKLDAMAEAGYFNDLFTTLFTDDIIATAGATTSAWIAANLLQETGYVIDNSLTVANAAADAKATGDAIQSIKNGLEILALTWSHGRINADGTIDSTPTNWVASDLFTAPETLTVFIDKGTDIIQIAQYGFDGTFTAINYFANSEETVSIPKGYKVRFCGRKSDSTAIDTDYLYEKFTVYTAMEKEDRITENAIYQLGETAQPNAFSSDFYLGVLSANEAYVILSRNRLYTNIMKYDHTIRLKAKTGYRFTVLTYTAGVYDSITGWVTQYTIPANQEFKIQLAADPDSSGIADVDEMKKQIYFVEVLPNAYQLPICNNGKMKLVAHTGLHTGELIGQSKPAYINAGKKQEWACECDIRKTSDGVFVCMHNASVDATTDGSGNVSEMTAAQIAALHLLDTHGNVSAESVPTFEEYLQICKTYGLVAMVEIKDMPNNATYAQPAIDLIYEYGMQSQTIIIISPIRVDFIRSICDLPIAILADDSYYSTALAAAKRNGCCMIDYNKDQTVTAAKIEECHESDIPFGVFTLNTKAAAQTYFDLGCDFVTSDSLAFEDWLS